MWTQGVPVDEQAKQQLVNIARMPFVHSHLAVMPDVHVGKGATVGSVIATQGAIIPAAVGVDIGCGMMAVQTSLKANDLPETLSALRSRIERAVPHGSVSVRGRAHKGSWGNTPDSVRTRWGALAGGTMSSSRSTRACPRRSRTSSSERWAAATTSSRFVSTPSRPSG
jgi:tRNA-splicing ligase RtcB